MPQIGKAPKRAPIICPARWSVPSWRHGCANFVKEHARHTAALADHSGLATELAIDIYRNRRRSAALGEPGVEGR
jgi:hypothetical protein